MPAASPPGSERNLRAALVAALNHQQIEEIQARGAHCHQHLAGARGRFRRLAQDELRALGVTGANQRAHDCGVSFIFERCA